MGEQLENSERGGVKNILAQVGINSAV